MDEHITPLVWSTIAQYGILSASFAAARDILKAWGIAVSLKRLERLTYRFGHLGLQLFHNNTAHLVTTQTIHPSNRSPNEDVPYCYGISSGLFRRTQGVNQLRQGNLPTTSILKDQRVVISVDGGRTRIRRTKMGKPRQTTNRHGYYGDWTEPKVLTIYVVDEQGKRINTDVLPVTNDGTFSDVETFMQLLETHLVRLGINQAKQVLLVADGAEWIWLRIPPLLKRLGCPPESIYELLDFYHAAEHLQQFVQAAFTEPTVVHAWFKQARKELKGGRVNDFIARMQTLVENSSGERQKTLAGQLAYFTTGQQHQRLNYSQVTAMKLPIGSGAIESLIRQVVNLRLKGTGKFWLLNHAQIVLHARCQWAAGKWAWANFCDSILTAMLYPA